MDEYHEKVIKYFHGNQGKANIWWQANNPNLGDISPVKMIFLGKQDKLKQWIDESLESSKDI